MIMFVKSGKQWYEVLSCEEGYGAFDERTGKELKFTVSEVRPEDIPSSGREYPGRGPASLAVQRVVGRISRCVIA